MALHRRRQHNALVPGQERRTHTLDQQCDAGGDQAVSVRVTGHQQAAAKLGQWDKKFQRNLLVMVGAFAGRLEAKAVQDRPWTDRTNAARNSITGSYDQIPGGMIVALAIGVEYGKYLE